MSDLFAGTDWDIINTNLTTSYQEVKYTKNIRGFRVQARGETNILHKRRDTDSKFVTIPANTGVPYTVILSPVDPAKTSLGFFKASSGTETLEATVFF